MKEISSRKFRGLIHYWSITMNPWLNISLSAYEGHMASANVMQLQALNVITMRQLREHPVENVMIMGVAGGNGLEHIDRQVTKMVYGVDINPEYLASCTERHPDLKGIFVPLLLDIAAQADKLPAANLIIANLFVEYVGCAAFRKAVSRVNPEWVSCVLQSAGEGFVSHSPFERAFDGLEDACVSVDANALTEIMDQAGYTCAYSASERLINGKIFKRLEYRSNHTDSATHK